MPKKIGRLTQSVSQSVSQWMTDWEKKHNSEKRKDRIKKGGEKQKYKESIFEGKKYKIPRSRIVKSLAGRERVIGMKEK